MREEFKVASGCAALATFTGLASVAFAVNGNVVEAFVFAGLATYTAGSACHNVSRGLTETIRETCEEQSQDAPQQKSQQTLEP